MRSQRGVALIVVLLIVAIIAIIATDISGRNQLAMRRTINLTEYDQAYWYAMSGEELVKKILKKDFDESKDQVNLGQNWAINNAVFPVEHGEIAGKVMDLRACFNLNALAQSSVQDDSGQNKMPLAVNQFRSLLVALGMDDFAAEKLSQTVKDYIDADSTMSPFGAEDADYQARAVPYRAANTLMQDKTELRAIIGVTQEVFKRLAPYICVIPGNDSQFLNVNTVTEEHAALLAGMLENKISVEEAENIINQRAVNGYKKIEDFFADNASILGKLNDQIKSSFRVNSNYFLLHSAAKVNQAIFQMQSVLKRSDKGFSTISRQFGVHSDEKNNLNSLQQGSDGEQV